MRLLPMIVVLGILLSSSAAQEVRYIELSNAGAAPNDEPAYGSMIEAYSCVGSKEPSPQQAKISLVWMETTDLYPSQRVGVEFRIENIGITPLKLPIQTTLTDLKPRDPEVRFTYYRMKLPLEAIVEAEGSALEAGSLDLYGSLQEPNTFITLKPGEWIRVRGDVSVRRWYKIDQTITASTELGLSKYVFPARKNSEKISSNQHCNLDRSTGGTPLNAYMHAQPLH